MEASAERSCRAASLQAASSFLWYSRVTMASPLIVVWKFTCHRAVCGQPAVQSYHWNGP